MRWHPSCWHLRRGLVVVAQQEQIKQLSVQLTVLATEQANLRERLDRSSMRNSSKPLSSDGLRAARAAHNQAIQDGAGAAADRAACGCGSSPAKKPTAVALVALLTGLLRHRASAATDDWPGSASQLTPRSTKSRCAPVDLASQPGGWVFQQTPKDAHWQTSAP